MKVRFRFTKLGKIRWTSHRDVARMWERALRRAALPVAYSGGFRPRPKLSFGLALSTGHESVAEYLDVELTTVSVDIASLPDRLSPVLPVGVEVLAAARIDAGAGSLQEEVTSTSWELEAVGAGVDELTVLVERALVAPSLIIHRERKGVEVSEDVRPGIISVTVDGISPCIAEGYDAHAVGGVLLAQLGTRPRGVRPAELLQAIGPTLQEGHVRRTHQWIERDGARWEPLPVGATDAPHANERAS
jgi:radical SAM-linked protein